MKVWAWVGEVCAVWDDTGDIEMWIRVWVWILLVMEFLRLNSSWLKNVDWMNCREVYAV